MGLFSRSGVALISFALLCSAAAAQTVLTEPAIPLLPQRFGAWEMQGTATTGKDANQVDDAHAKELQEDGLGRFATAEYKRGSATIQVRALQFVDATGASAALSTYRASQASLRPLGAGQKLGTEAAAGGDEVTFRTGNTLVLAVGAGVQPAELQALGYTLPKISGPKGMSPLLPTLLPPKGLDTANVRYALGPTSYVANGGALPTEILGFDKSAEVATASYPGRGHETLTLLMYPTPQIAGERGRALEAWVNAHPGGLGTVKLRREGPLVLMAAGGLPGEEAQQMIENVHLRAEVTWDKKMPLEFQSEIRKTASLLTSILILSGVLMLAAVLLGVFLGGGRAAFRVMRGKPAASDPEFLGLGLARGPVKSVVRQDR